MIARILYIGALSASLLSSAASAGPADWDETLGDPFVVVDHQPYISGGPAADTEFVSEHGTPGAWQLLADDFLLEADATIRHVTWWGFYGASGSPWEPPAGDESMRLRLYAARVGDGLPDDDNILYEESFLNPMREATGRTIAVGGSPDEYRFDVDLSSAVTLLADTQYWLEIVQVGDEGSVFRWEYSISDDCGHAYHSMRFDDWRHTEGMGGDLAFQLSTIPEPTTLTLLAIAVLMMQRCRKGKSRRA